MTLSRRQFLHAATSAGALTSLPLAGAAGEAVRFPGALGTTLRPARSDERVLTFGGDLFLQGPFPESLAPDTSELYAVLRGSDAAFANLENGLSTVGSPELGGFRYGGAIRGDPALVGELQRMAIRVVSLANNHTGNYGPDALRQTMETLDRAGIQHAGAGADIDGAYAARLVDLGGLRVAFLSLYSYYYHYGATDNAAADRPGIAGSRAYDVVVQLATGYDTSGRATRPYLLQQDRGHSQVVMAPLYEDVDRMRSAVRAAKAQADLAVLSVHFHWGRHTQHDLPLQQRMFAQAAVDAGVDVFVGHGPHALRGVEVYRGRPICYSLGNLTLRPPARPLPQSDDAATELPAAGQQGLLLRVTASRASGLAAVELLPIVIGADGQPGLSRGRTGERIMRWVAGVSATLGTVIEIKEWVGHVQLA